MCLPIDSSNMHAYINKYVICNSYIAAATELYLWINKVTMVMLELWLFLYLLATASSMAIYFIALQM